MQLYIEALCGGDCCSRARARRLPHCEQLRKPTVSSIRAEDINRLVQARSRIVPRERNSDETGLASSTGVYDGVVGSMVGPAHGFRKNHR
eukprot:6197656-Pleurochrysis_carterae.AAC.2